MKKLLTTNQDKYSCSNQAIDNLMKETSKIDYIPVKLGQTVYTIDSGDYNSNYNPFIQEKKVIEINNKFGRSGKELGWGVVLKGYDCTNRYSFTNLNKSWWINRENAEAKLRTY